MSKKRRKDKYGRALRTGESQLKSGAYTYRKMKNGRKIEFYAPTLEALRAKEETLSIETAQGVDVVASKNFTINDAYCRYEKNRTDLRTATREVRDGFYRNHLKDGFGKHRLKDVRYSDVVAFYLDLMENKGLSANTIDGIHGLLSKLYKSAIRDRLVVYNPLTGANTEAKNKAHKKPGKLHALTEAEQARFTDYVMHEALFDFWRPLVVFLFGTGCRIGEAGALTWADVDFRSEEIHIEKTIGCKGGYYINPSKTEKGIRIIPMFSDVKKALVKRRELQFEYGACSVEVDGYSNFVFTSVSGQPLTAEKFDHALRKMVAACNEDEKEAAARQHRKPVFVRPFSAHCIRHTFASRLVQSGMNLKTVQTIMGHADIKTTLNTYAEVSEKRKHDEIKALEGKLQIV